MEKTMTRQKSLWQAYLQAARPFSFTASMTPVFLGAALTLRAGIPARWELFPLVVVASLLIHAATNMVSEYFDWRKGVDRPDTLGGSRVIIDGLLTPRQVLTAGLLAFAATAAIGLVFVAVHGWPILTLGLIGIAGGFFYTAAPIGFKYMGLGDLCVFWLMGPLMVVGSFFVLTGVWSFEALAVSLPVGCLVAAILSGNNLRDIAHDAAADVRTTAGLLGHRRAKYEYAALVLSAYALVVLLALFSALSLWALAVLLTLPMAVRITKAALASTPDNPDTIAALDVQTAQTHLAFGVLLIASVLVETWLS